MITKEQQKQMLENTIINLTSTLETCHSDDVSIIRNRINKVKKTYIKFMKNNFVG